MKVLRHLDPVVVIIHEIPLLIAQYLVLYLVAAIHWESTKSHHKTIRRLEYKLEQLELKANVYPLSARRGNFQPNFNQMCNKHICNLYAVKDQGPQVRFCLLLWTLNFWLAHTFNFFFTAVSPYLQPGTYMTCYIWHMTCWILAKDGLS